MVIVLNILIVLFTFIAMESTHKYVMHGFLWNLHKDHHVVDKNKILQKNDYFLIFANFWNLIYHSYNIVSRSSF